MLFVIIPRFNMTLLLYLVYLLSVVCAGSIPSGRFIPFTRRDKLMIINYHNDIRSLLTSSNMQALSWDADAANKAREWGSDCIFNRLWDDNYGENIYKTYFTKTLRPREVMMDALKDWETEKQNLFSWDVKCTESDTCNYKQLVSASIDSVGCALIKCPRMIESKKTTHYNMYYFLCFYSPRVPLDHQPFKYSRKCSECPSGYSCKKNLCTEPHWTKIPKKNKKRKDRSKSKSIQKPVANIIIRETDRGIDKKLNVSNEQSNFILPVPNPPAEFTGRLSEKSFADQDTPSTRLNRQKRVKRETRYTYEEWLRRERLRRERLRAEHLYRREQERRRREEERRRRIEEERRRRNDRTNEPIRQRPVRQTAPGSVTSEEQNYLTQAHNLLRGNVMRPLKWSRYIQRWADYVIRCNVEYPGPITMYTNFGKTNNGGNIYNIVYKWGDEGTDTNRRTSDGCRTPSDRERCNHNTIVRNEFLREYACAARECQNGMRQLTCIYR